MGRKTAGRPHRVGWLSRDSHESALHLHGLQLTPAPGQADRRVDRGLVQRLLPRVRARAEGARGRAARPAARLLQEGAHGGPRELPAFDGLLHGGRHRIPLLRQGRPSRGRDATRDVPGDRRRARDPASGRLRPGPLRRCLCGRGRGRPGRPGRSRRARRAAHAPAELLVQRGRRGHQEPHPPLQPGPEQHRPPTARSGGPGSRRSRSTPC